MSATRYKRPNVDIFICIEMARERNQGTKKKPHPVEQGWFCLIVHISEIFKILKRMSSKMKFCHEA